MYLYHTIYSYINNHFFIASPTWSCPYCSSSGISSRTNCSCLTAKERCLGHWIRWWSHILL